jgi:Uma2 family endonuclease
MARVAVRSQLSAEEYLAWEVAQTEKHEYWRGEVFAMSGGKLRHNALGANAIAALRAVLRARGCVVLSSDQRIGIGGDRYVYPDVTVVCGALQVERYDVLTAPTILVEVLSRSTEAYDRGAKWEAYRSLPSLTDYVLLAQDRAIVEQFRREPGATWTFHAHGAGEHVTLANGATLAVDDLYDGVLALPAGDDAE